MTTNADTSATNVMMFVGFNNRMTEVHWLHQSALHKTCTVHTHIHRLFVTRLFTSIDWKSSKASNGGTHIVYVDNKMRNVWNEDS